jgi:hypothetical protein
MQMGQLMKKMQKAESKKLCSGPKGQTMSHQAATRVGEAYPISYYTKLSH